MQLQEDLIVYGTDGSNKEEAVGAFLESASPSSLKYERKLVCETPKSRFFVRVSDIHYSLDLNLLGPAGLVMWNCIVDQIRGSIAASGKREGLVVCYSVEGYSAEVLNAVGQCIGDLMGRTVRIFFWFITSSMCCLPRRIAECCAVHRVPQGLVVQKSWETLSSENMAKNIFSEIEKGDSLEIGRLRETLYSNEIVLLTIHNIVWPLLRMVVDERAVRGRNMTVRELYKLTKLCLSCCNGYEGSYRPIFHLERLALELSKAVDG